MCCNHKKSLKRFALLALLLLAASPLAGAVKPLAGAKEEEPTPATLAPATLAPATLAVEKPEPIRHLENRGLEVIRSFPVGAALVGWVVRFDDQELVVYTTSDGDYLINGVLLDARGVDLTEEHQKAWLPRPQWQDLEAAYTLVETSLHENEAGEHLTRARVYLFFDPNCPFSQLAWLALQPYRQAGLKIHWIPVAYLKPDSRHRAAALLDAEQPEELLALNMQNQGQPEARLDAAIETRHRQQLQANMNLMRSLGINGTPGWVWQDDSGKLQTLSGMPRLPRLPAITGLPGQEHPETELMRFR